MFKLVLFIFLIFSYIYCQNEITSKYLNATQYINSDNVEIITQSEKLSVNCKSDEEKVERLYNFVRDSYSDTTFESMVASDILKLGGNSCHQRSILFAALCRALNIPARLHWQKVIIKDFKLKNGDVKDITFMHGIVGVKLKDRWFLYEPVGNDVKWQVWVQAEESNTLEFKYDQNVLYSDTEKISLKTLPIYFSDYFVEMMALRKKINSEIISFN